MPTIQDAFDIMTEDLEREKDRPTIQDAFAIMRDDMHAQRSGRMRRIVDDPLRAAGQPLEPEAEQQRDLEAQAEPFDRFAAMRATVDDPLRRVPERPRPEKPIDFMENIKRAGGMGVIEKLPFSPYAMVKQFDILGATKRLQEDAYEQYKQPAKYQMTPMGGYTKISPPVPYTKERDTKFIEDYFGKLQKEAERDKTFMAKVGSGVSILPAWMLEFAATGGLANIGKTATRKFAEKIVKKQAAVKLAGWVGGAAARTAAMPHRVGEAIVKRQIDDPEEKWATSIAKGWGTVFIETASEEAGAAITGGLAKVAKKLPFGGKLLRGLEKAWKKIRPAKSSREFLKQISTKAGYSNFIGEVGEERLATIMHAIANTEDFGAGKDSNVFERLQAGIQGDIENLPVEAVVLALPGATRFAIAKMMDPTIETGQLRIRGGQQANFKKMALVEQGAAKIAAMDPYTAGVLANKETLSRSDLTKWGVKGKWSAEERSQFQALLSGAVNNQEQLEQDAQTQAEEIRRQEDAERIRAEAEKAGEEQGLEGREGERLHIRDAEEDRLATEQREEQRAKITGLKQPTIESVEKPVEKIKGLKAKPVAELTEPQEITEKIERQVVEKNKGLKPAGGPAGPSVFETGVGAASRMFSSQNQALEKAQKLAKKNNEDFYVIQQQGGEFVVQKQPPETGYYTIVNPKGQATFIKQASLKAEDSFDYGEHIKEKKNFTDKLEEFKDKLKEKEVNVKALQDELFKMVKASGMSPAKVKAVVGLLRNINPKQQDKTNVKTLMKAIARASEYTEQENRRILRKAIVKELKKAKVKKKRGIKKGKLTPEVQRRLDFIKSHIAESHNVALEKMALNIKKVQDGEMTDVEMLEKNALLGMTSIKDMTSREMLTAYEGIKRLRENGKLVHDTKIAEIKERRKRIKARMLDILTKSKGLKKGAEALPERDIEKKPYGITKFNRWGSAFDNILDYLSRFDKTSKPYESDLSKLGDLIHVARHEATKGSQEQQAKVHEAFQEIFGIKSNWKMHGILHEMQKRNVDLGTFTNAIGEEITLDKLSKEELIKRYMEFQDPTLDETFRGVTKEDKNYGMHYTDEMMDAVKNNLTKQEKAWADWHIQNYKDYRPSISKVYSEMYFVDMSEIFNYSPINRMAEQEEFEETLLFKEVVRHASATNPSLIQRVRSILPIKWTEADPVLMNHITRMEHFKAYARPVRELRSLFSDKDVRAAIKQYHGRHILKRLDLELDQFARGGIDQMLINNWLDRARRNFITAALARPAIALKQIPSSLAYITEMPLSDYIEGITRFWLRPIKHTKELLEYSPIFRDSVKQGHERDIRLAMAKSGARQIAGTKKFRDWLFSHIKLGDFIGRSTQWAKWKSVQKRENLGAEEAMRRAEKTTSRTQPGWWIGELSEPQKGGSLWKIFTMFQTQPIRYYNIAVDNARNAAYGRGSRAKNLSNLALIWVIMPMLFNWIADAFQWKKKHQLVSITLGPFSYMPIAGKLIYNTALALVGEAYGTQLSPMQTVPERIKRATHTVGKMFRASKDPTKDITNEDVIKLAEQFGEVVGYTFGLPTPYLIQAEKAIRKQVAPKPQEIIDKLKKATNNEEIEKLQKQLEEIQKTREIRVGWRDSYYAEFLFTPYSLKPENKIVTKEELEKDILTKARRLGKTKPTIGQKDWRNRREEWFEERDEALRWFEDMEVEPQTVWELYRNSKPTPDERERFLEQWETWKTKK